MPGKGTGFPRFLGLLSLMTLPTVARGLCRKAVTVSWINGFCWISELIQRGFIDHVRKSKRFPYLLEPLSPLWYRFIVDIFIAWQHGEERQKEILESLNKFSLLHFAWAYSVATITFLDVDVFLKFGNIKTKLHSK